MNQIDHFTRLSFENSLSAMIKRLEAWATKPDANQETIAQREAELKSLAAFYSQYMELERNQQKTKNNLWLKFMESEKKVKKYEEILTAAGLFPSDLRHFDKDFKEIRRSNSIATAHRKWPEMY